MPSPNAVRNRMIASYIAVVVVGVIMLLNPLLRPARSPHPPPRRAPGVRLDVATRLTDRVALYPRAIRLAHSGAANGRIIASVVSQSGTDGVGEIYESADDGASFTHVGTIADVRASGGRGLCCGTLFEVPRRTGRTPAGTLLWAGSTGQHAPNRRMALRVWQSGDHGRTWSFLSTCATAGDTLGLWEPELSMDFAGRLVCHFSDETQPGHSQALAQVVSTDGGYTWGRRADTVIGRRPRDRPGMAVVRELPYGVYVMTYEMCTERAARTCPVHLRVSIDGQTWAGGDELPQTARGERFEHSPTLAWVPGQSMFGRLLLIGQVLATRDGQVAPGSGRVILTNGQRGAGPWTEVPAPLALPADPRDSCSNYSSALLPSADGTRVLELASRTDPDGVCRAYFATGPLR